MLAVIVRFATDPPPPRFPTAAEIVAVSGPGDRVEHVTVVGPAAVVFVRAHSAGQAEARVRALFGRGGWRLAACVHEPLEEG